MLRKLVLGIMFCFLFLGSVGAHDTGWVKTYVVENKTAAEATTYIATTTLVPNQSRILSWTVTPSKANSLAPYVSVWDETSLTLHSLSNLIGESETPANTTQDKPFPYPRNISNQVKVILGPYSSIIIEYTK